VRGEAAKLGEGCPKVGLGKDRLPNRAISACSSPPISAGSADGNRQI
jgi:hypothetical protein